MRIKNKNERKFHFQFRRRRTPKKTLQKNLIEGDAEKLSQEAFRLYRTTQNLLNLKEPMLSETKSSQFIRNVIPEGKATSFTGSDGTLQRKLKSRESRTSYHSNGSTSEGSINSNSSSGRNDNECDSQCCDANGTNIDVMADGNQQLRTNGNILSREMEMLSIGKEHHRIKSVASNSADDESGFSSMNSFHHDVPTTILPQSSNNSTMISNRFSLDTFDDARVFATLPEIKPALPIMHKRWDSAPPIPPKKNLATFSSLTQNTIVDNDKQSNSSNGGGIHVLWV